MTSISETSIVNGYTTPTDTRPYMKPRALRVNISGLRPNTDLFVFFNGVDVSQYCRPATIPEGGLIYDGRTWEIEGSIGDTVTSTDTGSATFQFYIPKRTFLVGTGTLVVKDGANDSYTTKAETTFNSLNYPNGSNDDQQSRLVQVEATTNDRLITNRNSTNGNSFSNPISQTFFISANMAGQKEGIYATKLDLFFKTIDPTFGVTVEIRDVENGTPTNGTLPLSRVRKSAGSISTTGATSFQFPGLVMLRAGREFAITVIPDAGGSNCVLHSAKIGEIDIDTGEAIAKTWGDGKLFLSTNGSSWPSITDEAIKFTLYTANFTSQSGWGKLTNRDYEFLNVANTTGTWIAGEYVSVRGVDLAGQVTANTASKELIGLATTFTTTFNVGEYVTIVNSSTDLDVIRIQSIANNTSMMLQKAPSFANSAASYQRVPTGIVDSYSGRFSRVTVIDSTASNSSFLFAANTIIVGADSGAISTITSVDNRNVNSFQPLISASAIVDTEVRLYGDVLGSDYTTYPEQAFSVSGTNTIRNRGAIIASKSNEIVFAAGRKSISMNLALSSTASQITPTVDLSIPSLALYGNRINSNSANEHLRSGAALSKGLSKPITLGEGLDSEDMFVYASIYRPYGTDIKMYAKILNSSDPAAFDDKHWTELSLVSGQQTYSDSVDESDFIELQWTFPSSPPVSLANGTVTTSNTSANVTGVGTTFNSGTLATGSVVRITSGAAVQFGQVSSVTNATHMVLYSNAAFSTTVGSYANVTTPKTAFKNPQNDQTVRYFDTSGVYDTYKVYAVKYVLLADNPYLAPYVDDVRVLNVS